MPSSPNSFSDSQVDDIYNHIGEFGWFQLGLFIIIGSVSLIPSVVAYGSTFYIATPEHRCKIPNLANDTFEIWGDYQQQLVNKYIPPNNNSKLKVKYDECHIKLFSNDSYINITSCNEWVFSKEFYETTLVTEWKFVCDRSDLASLISTLFFIGTFGVLFNGFMSDKFGRKRTIYIFAISNAIVFIIIALVVNLKAEWVGGQLSQEILFMAMRFLSGTTSYTYTAAVVLTIELCGASKRVFAVNTIYYFYIAGEFVVVTLAYLIRKHNLYLIANAIFMTSFILFFWVVPESPRWLITKKKYKQAYQVYKKIAQSNKKPLDSLNWLKNMDQHSDEFNNDAFRESSDSEAENTRQSVEKLVVNGKNDEKSLSFINTVKILFSSRKLVLTSVISLVSWLANTFVYYGISFNTSELAGNPYLNFTLSALTEIVAITMCHFTLDKFGRKIPYSIHMILAGLSLLSIQFVPNEMEYIVTILALIGKYSISFTFNSIYMITAELFPTVIRNSSVAICQGIGRLGAVISPEIQALGRTVWYPLPFLIYGAAATISAILFILFTPETKGRHMPDSIEEFVEKNK